MFSIQLAGEPVAVSISGIFDLDYSYVFTVSSGEVVSLDIIHMYRVLGSQICGSAITYIIVILQFGGDKFLRFFNKTPE